MDQILHSFRDYSSRRVLYAAIAYLIFFASYARIYYRNLDEQEMNSPFRIILSFFDSHPIWIIADAFHLTTLISLFLMCIFIVFGDLEVRIITLRKSLVFVGNFVTVYVFTSFLLSFPLFFALPVFVFSFFKSPGLVVRIIKYTIYGLATLLYAALAVNSLLTSEKRPPVSELWIEISGFTGAVCLVLSLFFFFKAFDPPPNTTQFPGNKGR